MTMSNVVPERSAPRTKTGRSLLSMDNFQVLLLSGRYGFSGVSPFKFQNRDSSAAGAQLETKGIVAV
ncbi:MAG: hypothetical protein LBR88_10405, partial [Zoogloeaceae bacterium]|nr:hypothetical protein [Zoogloeaceae bacterium]